VQSTKQILAYIHFKDKSKEVACLWWWKVEGGRWKVEGGRWKVEGGRWIELCSGGLWNWC